jgi:hypothetical protein
LNPRALIARDIASEAFPLTFESRYESVLFTLNRGDASFAQQVNDLIGPWMSGNAVAGVDDRLDSRIIDFS